MPLTIAHNLTATTPDDPGYEIRPSHWNDSHAFTLSAAGSEIAGAFSNANGLSFGLSGGQITGSYTVPTQTAFQLSNSNGVSFGTNGSTVTATVRTDYASSNHSHGNPSLALTNLSGTTASNSAGFTLSLSAAAAGGGGDGYNILAAGSQTANTTGTVQFANSNGITFGMSGSSQITASHNGLTTAAQSDHSHGNPTLNLTNLSGTTNSNSAGFTLSLSAAAQTVQTQNMVSVQGSTGNVQFGNANGVTFGFNASTITASHNGLTSQSNQAFSAGGGSSAFQTLSFSNGNGVTFTNTNGQVGASVATTYRASNDAVGLNAAQSNVTWTVNSSGLSLDASGYAGTGTTFAGANVSGSMTVNSNGVNLSLSAAAPGGGAAINVSAGTTSGNLQTVQFNNANGVSFGLNGSTLTASHNGLTTGALSDHSHGNPSLALTNLSGTTASNSAGFTLSLSAAAPGGGAASTLNMWVPYQLGNNTVFSSHGQNSAYFQRLWPQDNYSFSYVEKMASISFASSTNSQAVSHTIRYGLYSRDTGVNSTRMTQIAKSAVIFQASYNSNTQGGYTISESGGGSFTSTSGGTALFTALSAGKLFYFPFTSTLSAGQEYAFGFHVSTASAVGIGPARLSFLEQTILNNTTLGRIFMSTVQAGAASVYDERDGLIFSTTTGALPLSYADNAVSAAVSRARQFMIFET